MDQKWWNKNKGLLVPTGFGKLLGAYEIVADQLDYAKQLTALAAIENALQKVIAASVKDKDTVAVLRKFPALINIKKSEAKKKLEEEKNKPQVQTAPPQKIQGKEVLWSRDVAEQVAKEVDWLKAKDYKVNLLVNGDVLDLLDKLDGGSTTAFMMQDAETICRKYVEVIKALLLLLLLVFFFLYISFFCFFFYLFFFFFFFFFFLYLFVFFFFFFFISFFFFFFFFFFFSFFFFSFFFFYVFFFFFFFFLFLFFYI